MRWNTIRNDYELTEEQKKDLIKVAVKNYIGVLEKKLNKEKKQAKKWGIKQIYSCNESRAKRITISAKTQLYWESVREIESKIAVLKEFSEGGIKYE